MQPQRARWVSSQRNPRNAGLRYRCIYPMRALAASGRDVGFWEAGDTMDAGLTLVFNAWSLFPTVNAPADARRIVALAEQAHAVGARIVLDNCDNQYAANPAPPDWAYALRHLEQMAALAQTRTYCSHALASAMQHAGAGHDVVIDDPIEEAIVMPGDDGVKRWFSPSRRQAAWQLARHAARLRVDQRAQRKLLVWFGSHGNPFSAGGMLDLLDKQAVLTDVNRDSLLSLTVISNHPAKFRTQFQGWAFPLHYLPWDRTTFHRAVALHDVCLIPSQDNAFTRCKSSNRLVQAAYLGLDVLADPVPSYDAYRPFARIGDWDTNLRALLAGPKPPPADVAQRRAALTAMNGIAVITRAWSAVLF